MKLKDKIIIDFEEFFSTGRFDFLKLGKTKEWVINNFPDPDGFDEYPQIYKDDIWRYGNIELHFHKEKLFLIFSDYIHDLKGGEALQLNKWFLQNTDRLKLSDVISELNGKQIDFQKITNKTVNGFLNLVLKSGVSLGFYLEGYPDETIDDFDERCKLTNQDEYELGSFSLMQK